MYQEPAERVGEENGKGGGDASECHCELATPGRQAGAGETTARVAECNGMAISTALTCACLRSRGPEREGGRGFLWLCHCLVVCATAVGDRSPEKRRSRFDFRPAFAIMSGSHLRLSNPNSTKTEVTRTAHAEPRPRPHRLVSSPLSISGPFRGPGNLFQGGTLRSRPLGAFAPADVHGGERRWLKEILLRSRLLRP